MPNRLTYKSANHAVLEPVELPALDLNKVLVRSNFSAISRGTESLVFKGQVPKTEHVRMRCPYQVGDFSFPVSYGYSCVGIIEEVGGDVTDLMIGDTVFVLHPHQDLFQVDAQNCNPLPAGLSPEIATLSANAETALNANWDAEPFNGGNIAIIGAGVVGLLTAYVSSKRWNITPTVIDIDPAKREIVETLGFNFAHPDVLDTEYSTIFHTSASAAGLQTAINHASFEAKIIEMSWYGEKSISLNLGGAFHSKRLQIISSQVGSVSPAKRETTTYKERMSEAMTYLCDPLLINILDEPIDFADIPTHLEDIYKPDAGKLCQIIKYPH